MATKSILSCAIIITAFFSVSVHAQTEKEVRYYVTLNNVNERTVHVVSDFRLNLQYEDRYGNSRDFLFRIYDWQRNQVAVLQMDKSPGMNQYSIRLDEIYSGWKMNEIYYAEMKDEAGKVYTLPVRIVEPPEMPDPVANIIVNPVKIGCEDLTGSSVEFYGEIAGGAAPYQVKWYVLNQHRTDFLYQPKEEMMELPGKTSMIIVDHDPEYNVVLFVKDACGKENKQIVSLACGKDKKKINSVFVEELTLPRLTGN